MAFKNKEHARTYMQAYRKRQSKAQKRRHAAKVMQRVRKLLAWFREYKATLACIRCGEDHPHCLDFHHRDPTKKDVLLSRAVRRGWSKEHILKEAAKCDVLCANCHRKEHYRLRQ